MRPLRRTNTTVLLVCEGYAEIELARVIRDNCRQSACPYANGRQQVEIRARLQWAGTQARYH